MFTAHCAYNVTVPLVAKFFTLSLFEYFVPVPSDFVFHPANAYPVFVYPFAVRFLAVSYVCVELVVVPFPPLALYSTV